MCKGRKKKEVGLKSSTPDRVGGYCAGFVVQSGVLDLSRVILARASLQAGCKQVAKSVRNKGLVVLCDCWSMF